jgi:CHAD domain-containing protein
MMLSATRKKNKRATSVRPTLEVETTVSMVSAPKLTEWLEDLSSAVERVRNSSDDEAVHDLRVALRRIRSLLRLVAPVYGQFHVDSIREELKRTADATGALRDEEVLLETLEALKLDPGTLSALRPFLDKRTQREKTLRNSVIRLLADGSLDAPMRHLHALLALPCNPKKDKEARAFARHVVLDAQLVVDERRLAEVSDVLAMHELRISHKRLRYAIEAFLPSLPPELRVWKDVSTKFQRALGDLHDHDVAIEIFQRASMIPEAARETVVSALIQAREKIAADYLELVGSGFHSQS